jgi:ABC-type transporter MlaC component
MKWRFLMIVVTGMAMTAPALAQQTNTNDLIKQLKNTNPNDLAAQANEALTQYNQMTPQQRAAASAAAQSQVPALIGAATDWWNTLTPEQKAEYQKSIQGLSGAMNPK